MPSWLHSICAGDEGRAGSPSTVITTKRPEGSRQRRAGGLASPEEAGQGLGLATGPARLEED